MKDEFGLSPFLGVFLVSLAAISFQLALSRLFSVALSYHFAFMVVSLALLGYGASGSFLTVFPGVLGEEPHRLLSLSAVFFSVTCVGTYLAANRIPFDPFRISWDRLQLVYLFADYLLLSVPFFFSGLAVAGMITYRAADVGKVYCYDLAGAGLGALLALFLFIPYGGEVSVLMPSMTAALAAVAFAFKRPSCRWITSLSFVILGCSVFLLVAKPAILRTRISPYKSLKMALWYPGSKILDTRWNASSRVDVVESPLVRFAPGLSLEFGGSIPAQLGITVDGDNMTAMTRYDGSDSVAAFVKHLPDALAYEMAERDRVLVIEPGGGLGVLMALVLGAEEVDAVFNNPLMVDFVFDEYGAFGGNLLKDPRVTSIVKNGRSFLRQTEQSYDAIQYSPISSLGASSTGLRGLQENYMFTVEAIVDAFHHLKPQGVLSITQYLLPPPRQEIRLFHVVLEALKRMRIGRPETHIAMTRSWGTFTLLLKRMPLSEEEIQRIRAFCEGGRFDTVYFPGITEREANRFNRFPHAIYFEMVQRLLSETEKARLVRDYLFDLRPVTDDNPFFFNFFRMNKIVSLYRVLHRKWQPFVEGGYLVPIVLVESIIASALLILVPVFWRRRNAAEARRLSRFWVLVYFALLGWGYMFIEIVLIQKLILFLDHPVHAMATVIFGLLLSSGVGSFLSQSVKGRHLARILVPVLFILGVLIWGYLHGVHFVIDQFLGLGLGYRVAIILVVVFPLGFLMGIPFPMGIRLLKQGDPTAIPWAWSANGCFSVMGAVLCAVLALGMGFSRVLIVAGIVYLVGAGVASILFLNLPGHGNKTDTAHVLNV